jgi:hypothetical protein
MSTTTLLPFLDSLFPKNRDTHARKERIFSFEEGSSGSHHVESSFWKRLWTRRKTYYLKDE